MAHIINKKYGTQHYFQSSLQEIVISLPESLIINDEAMHDLLSKLQEGNKDLLVAVGNHIKAQRLIYEENKKEELEQINKFQEDYKNITEEFKL